MQLLSWNLLIVLLWHVLFLETLENCFHSYVYLLIRQINDVQAWILWFGSVTMGISWCLIRHSKTTFFHVILDCITILLKRAINTSAKNSKEGFLSLQFVCIFLLPRCCSSGVSQSSIFLNWIEILDTFQHWLYNINAPWRARKTVYGLYCLYL